MFYSYSYYSSSDSVSDSFQSEVCVCVLLLFLIKGLMEGFSGSCITGYSCCLTLIKSNIFEHVSTTAHHCWLRLCIIVIVICLLATCPYLHQRVRAHLQPPPLLLSPLPQTCPENGSCWIHVFKTEGEGRFFLLTLLYLLASQESTEHANQNQKLTLVALMSLHVFAVECLTSRKTMCMSLIMPCSSVLLPHSLLRVQ